jgi:hypothetical protein
MKTILRSFWFKHYLGQRFQWYRRWFGGRWELWWIDICCSFIWLDIRPDRKWPEHREPCSIGRPFIEDYPIKGDDCKTMCGDAIRRLESKP